MSMNLSWILWQVSSSFNPPQWEWTDRWDLKYQLQNHCSLNWLNEVNIPADAWHSNPSARVEGGTREHEEAQTVSALHHLSPTPGIRFPVPRFHQGQKFWSQMEIKINYIEKETCTFPLRNILLPCSPPRHGFRNSCCSSPQCPHCWQPGGPGGQAQGRAHKNSAQSQPSEGGKDTFLVPLCVHLK